MTTHKQLIAWAAALALCAAPALYAEVITGSYTNSFSGSPSLWDVSGTYSDDLAGMGTANYTLSLDPGGKITGHGTAHFSDESGGYLDGDASLSGTLRSAGSLVRVNLTMKMSGSGVVEGYDVKFTGTLNERFELDATNRQLLGTISGRVTVAIPSLRRQASGAFPRTDLQTSLPQDASSAWDLALLNVTTNRTKYSGSGAILLANGTSLPLTATGSYVAKTDTSRLTLRGQDLYRGVSLSVVAGFTNAQLTIKSLNGRALGQTLRVPAVH